MSASGTLMAMAAEPSDPTEPSDGAEKAAIRVWIDQDLCTGDGICTDHAPEVFVILEDGIAYCQEDSRVLNDPGGAAGLALVPPNSEAAVIASASECPGECIFIEFDQLPAVEA